ncbi:UDP-3-O-(3-hydroxymyristoyl)glucosamine N-acyltransferase [Thiocystis violacea]|uniref:UDP-3-O-(3-hydroxymyristoyl)glucosamine N-acyltransferase n=1 Tax=Thiocystis violacea TaxID=13725 RepID=UPI001906AA03|nr:UDP-3-O-(3-hydroxymyristoyl)glucosamine N-acyltransferase [Thiocystis violacea]MBK1723417.1 UDP-3-O-(3-hydroxymyristoyl)glucosamine N-acyltransferase [Thiocystis violacea]
MVLDRSQLYARLGLAPPDFAADPLRISGVSTLALASGADLCFAERADQAEAVAATDAGAVLVPPDFPETPGRLLIRTPNPRRAFFELATAFAPAPEPPGIHASAVVDREAVIGAEVAVGACAVIAAGARIGDRTRIGAGCFIGRDVSIGADCVIEANVTILNASQLGERCIIHPGTVIGGDGFGFHWDGQRHSKIPQLGRVVIEADVEIGCNCCVDCATLGITRVRRGTKIDNLVQVAHNTDIGEHVILVSQAGVAGSSRVGTGAVIAGQVAISDHVSVGAGARVGGQSGVTKDVPAGATVFGTPARPMKDTLRELAALTQLPELLKQIRRQERELDALRERLEALEGTSSPASGPGND